MMKFFVLAAVLYFNGATSGPVRDDCGRECMIGCYYGHALDNRGCKLCRCNPPPLDRITGCQKLICVNPCREYTINENGCQTCACSEENVIDKDHVYFDFR